ncbi:MAG: type VI secretion system ATPase TssH [Proteobacteria bacterium]|uniref:Type VI secretion system ATPase TssH n=1 Tax=Candidatus Avisuccinivibrio stercorigallinarum TaxID=2840704 RepID=A0A9D9DD88_9GAMM|nr:type VI secretion system ATPase TssH [Candidatus Avisuccinivibrio stercorigallinarum]
MKLKRMQIFSKLNQTCYKSLESATLLCKTRTNPCVEVVHFLNQLLLGDNNDLHQIVSCFKLDAAKLASDLVRAMDRLPRGAHAVENFSPSLELMVKEGWMAASLAYGSAKIRSGALILALKQSEELCYKLHEISPQFKLINGDLLQENLTAIVKDSVESAETAAPATAGTAAGSAAAEEGGAPAGGSALERYCQDLTQRAREGELDPVVGRDAEIRRIIDILLRRRQNNPILTGEAGVGKTAVAEGFAQRLASGDVPEALQKTSLLSLDLGLLQAGASMKGEFENRLKQVIDEVSLADHPIILFIDEAHTLIGAGGAAGQNDAANLLKPALARGKLRCIAATTYQEYIKYFEKDPALTRRFEKVMIEEPDDDKAVQMLRGMSKALCRHHQVKILDEALLSAVKLSRRYLPSRQLPDKAVSVLDTACAKTALSQQTEPAALEYARRELEALKLEQEILQRESTEGFERTEELTALSTKKAAKEAEIETLNARYQAVLQAGKDYLQARQALGSREASAEEREKLRQLRRALDELQGDSPLLLPEVDAQAVSTVIAEWTGIPLGRMVKDEISSVLHLAEAMKERVIGQDHSLDLIARRITTARAGLADPGRPTAVLMLAGPSGVGKTETALTLAEQVYGTERNLITINMSEFQEAHTVSTLKGAPPGYVGYGEGGVLTEAVRRRPYSVVLLDEVEKAHKDVHELFFQIFDKGQMEDGTGRLIDFKNTIILLTTNVGDQEIMDLCSDENNLPDTETLEKAVRPAMLRVFPAALLGRLSVIPYYPLSRASLIHIIDLKLNKIVRRVAENYKAEFTYTQAVRDEIIARCNNVNSGARLIDAIISNDLLPLISSRFLELAMQGLEFAAVKADCTGGHFNCSFVLRDGTELAGGEA